MFFTLGVRCITVIFLALYVTASNCDQYINVVSRDLAQYAIRIKNATTHCKTDPDQCSVELSSIVEYVGAAKDSVSNAVAGCLAALRINQDCLDDGKYVGQDFAIIGAKAFKIVQDCVLSKSDSCADDANFIVMAIDDAIASVDKSIKDCDFPAGSECANDFALLAVKLAESKEMFIQAEDDCKVYGDACIDDMLEAVSEFLDASSWALTSIYDCTNSMPRRHDH